MPTVYFILVEPAVPENTGAAARAIKTMGFNNLRLVNPSGFPVKRAEILAHGAKDVLNNAEIYKLVQKINPPAGTNTPSSEIKLRNS